MTKTNIPPRHLSGCLGGAKSRPPVGTSVEDDSSTAGRVDLDRRSSEPVSHRPTVEGYPTTGRADLGFPTSGRQEITSPFTNGGQLIKLVILKHSFTGREMTSTRSPVVRDKNFTFLLERLTHLSSQSIAIIPS